MTKRRKTWQHDFEEISEAQLTLFFKEVMGWTVDRFGKDYGEDLFVRVFKKGNPTGRDFYVQLKGTDDIQRYSLKNSPVFSYPVSLTHLRQWQGYEIPVVFILWDISQRMGYWLHIQSFTSQMLQSRPTWLDNTSDARDPHRNIHIPQSHGLRVQDIGSLQDLLKTEYERIRAGREQFKQLEKKRIREIEPSPDSLTEAISSLRRGETVPPSVEQQLKLTEYQATLASDPSNVRAWLGLANVYYQLHELDKALRAIDQAWELDSADPQVIHSRGCVLAEYAIAHEGKPRSMLLEAISLFERMQDKGAEPSIVDYNIGNSLAGLGEHRKAVHRFDEALSEEPIPLLEAQIWKNRGTSFYHLGDYDKEVESYRRALEVNPNLWEAYASWGVTEMRRRNLEKARDLLTECFRVNPQIGLRNYRLLYTLAYACWKLGHLVEAYRRVNQLLAFKHDHKDGLLLKGHILAGLWERDPAYIPSAMSFYKKRILDDPDDVLARSQLYWIYNSEGYTDEARVILEDTVKLEEAPPQALYHYAMVLETERKFSEAIKYLETAFKKWQAHHISHSLAHLKARVGDYEDAIYYYGHALRDVTDPVPVLHSIADCYHLLKEHKECVRVMGAVILIDPEDASSWTNLLFSFRQLGKRELFKEFVAHVRGLQTGETSNRQEIKNKAIELVEAIRTEFGGEFVETMSPDTWLVRAED